MKTSMKKLGTVLLTVALLISALGGFVYAADGNYVSLHVEKTSDTEVTVTVKTIQPIDDILSLNAKFTVPDGFSFKSMTSVLSTLGNLAESSTPSWMTSKLEGSDNIAANENLYTVVFEKSDAIAAGTYTFGFEVTSAGTGAYTQHAIKGESVTETLTITPTVESISLNQEAISMVVGDEENLTATVEPEGAADKVEWTSSDEDVVTVDENGKITAVGEGTATITATAGGKTATCTVTVTAKPVPITGISLDDAEVSVGRTIQLKPKFTPADTTQRGVTWESSDETKATVDENGLVKGIAEGEVTITATSKENQSIKASCKVTVTKKDSTIVIPGEDGGAGVIAGGAIISGIGGDDLPFTDVSFRNYYYNAVKWAVDKGITSGTSRYTFSPDVACTRAQVVTFLWRAAGSPAPMLNKNPFTDVHTSDYYYDAVLWAVQNGITTGTSATTFSPDAAVSRAQAVTFLWRANGQPAAGNSGFVDVSSNAYYAKAVDWTFANGITTGMDYGAFGPDTACTRAQIVTFLYRAR